MSTPAEIIAARVNGTYVPEVPEVSPKKQAPKPVSKENAFPVLGGRQSSPAAAGVSNANTAWGPGAKDNGATASAPLTPGSSRNSPAPSSKSAFKGSNIQEAFSLDAEDQLNVTKAEFIKILTAIKTETKASIECTISQHTKKRTFLITGAPEAVRLAKRLVIKKLTKPVSVVFTIPAQVRAKVIGAQGRNLKPIISENEVKIDIGNVESSPDLEEEDDDDVFAKTVQVTIEGDAEGSKRAKAAILAIVSEKTKNLSVRVAVSDFVKPFASKAIAPLEANYPGLEFTVPAWNSVASNVIISGDRPAVLAARDELRELLASLEATLSVESVPIPEVKRQFLPIEKILEEENVLIQIPENPSEPVKFIGSRTRIPQAQEKARQTTSQYKVEVLDMSKAHKGNLPHVRAVASYLTKVGKFQEIAEAHGIAVNPPTHETLIDESTTSLKIEIVTNGSDPENIKQVRKAIVGVVNKISPEKTLVVNDINSFLLPKVPEILDTEAPKHKVEYVVLGQRIVLFDTSEAEESDDFDFVESEQSNDNGLAEVNKSLDKLREVQESLHSVVLEIDGDLQKKIAGPDRTTLKLILADFEPDTVAVELHNDGEKADDHKLYINGVKASVEKVAKEIEQAVEEWYEYEGQFNGQAEVPASIVARLIGKNGVNINNIKEEYGVEITAGNRDKEADAKTSKVEIAISGNKKNVNAAAAHLTQLGKRLADDTIARIRVENQYHRQIAGPNFVYVKRLEDKYNVKIRFPSENESKFSDSPASKDEIVVRGPTRGVAKAEEELKELYAFEKENGFKETIEVPVKAVPRVIGKNGDTIKDIADGFGVGYRFKRNKEEEEEAGFAELELTGSRSALKEAKSKVKELIDEVENFVSVTINVPVEYHRDLVGPGGSRLREIISKAGGDDVARFKFRRLLQVPDEGSGSDEVTSAGEKEIVDKIIAQVKKIVEIKEATIEEVYDLAKEKHRLLVGQQGSIRHQLEDEFNVNIRIPRPQDESTEIVLKGLPENLEKLKVKLDEMTKDNWKQSIDVPGHLHSLVSEKGAIFSAFKSDHGVEISHGNLTRKASKLSGSSIPTPPEQALADEEEKAKFTTALLESEDDGVVIPWRFIGSEEATAKAAKLVQERLDKAQAATHAGWYYSKDSKKLFPRLVGPSGRNLKKLREQTGAFITVPRPNDKYNNYIYVVGSEESLKKVEEALSKTA